MLFTESSFNTYTHTYENTFNMRRGDEDIEGGLRKFLDTRKGGSEKIRGGGAPRICILQNQQEGGGGGGVPKKLNC